MIMYYLTVNDVITTGAKPLFFLDYFGCGKLDIGIAEQVISGIAEGCKIAECGLIGGETAELPGMYKEGEYDIAGFSVGVVARKKILGKDKVKGSDKLIAIGSNGLHSNGYSLARKVLDEMGLSYDSSYKGFEGSIGEELLKPTKIYTKAIRELILELGEKVHAISHITGGGIVGNLPRVIPNGIYARINDRYKKSLIFEVMKSKVELEEMRKVFNMGIGMIVVVAEEVATKAVEILNKVGEESWICGELVVGVDKEAWVEYY